MHVLPSVFFSVLLLSIAQAQTDDATKAAPQPVLQAILELDANMDTTLERDEIPEAGLKAFETLLKNGDANGNGKLEAEELRGLADKVRQVAAIGPARFEKMDKDQDGILTKEEFAGPAPLFARMDADGDGKITKEEVAKFAGPPTKGAPAKPGAGLPKKGRALMAMDTDGDGKVSRDEFKGRPAQFKRIDVNEDGFLDRDEIRERINAAAKKAQGKAQDPKEAAEKPAPNE